MLVFDYIIDTRDIEIRENKCLSLKPPKRPVFRVCENCCTFEDCIGVLGIQDILPFYFQRYGIQ